MPITLPDIRAFKERGQKFVMLTAYDGFSATLLDQAGIPLIFIGDTLGEVMLGYPSTVPVTMDEIVHHAKAVRRGVRDAFVVGDLPFMSYQVSVEDGMLNAGRLMKEAGVNCVKLEGATRTAIDLVGRLTAGGVPVMAHLGLTPQSIHQLGGHRVQGRDETTADRILRGARELERAGAFAVVLEAVPASLAKTVTESLEIPTIGIGAGPHCDGQVLVFHDFLGITPHRVGRYVKKYAEVGEAITEAARRFKEEVARADYPLDEHSYG